MPNSEMTCGMNQGKIDETEVHVLAVDDNDLDRKIIEHFLKLSSYKVTTVDSGNRALQFLGLDKDEDSVEFKALKIDLIITDYTMPGMTGYELLKKIKRSSAFGRTPVVIMSSENVISRVDRCMEEGAEDFIVKPVKLSDVKRLKAYTEKYRVSSLEDEAGAPGEPGDDTTSSVNKRDDASLPELSPSVSFFPAVLAPQSTCPLPVLSSQSSPSSEVLVPAGELSVPSTPVESPSPAISLPPA